MIEMLKFFQVNTLILMQNCQNWIHFQVNRPGQADLQFYIVNDTQCEYFRIFPLLRFYVKSVLQMLAVLKNVDFGNFKGFEISFLENFSFQNVQNS